ncbi:tyrosine-type recombinase/integrase [Natrinema thermotolerans]|uniref:tyrosine-type recombinase/integrase n=1 Tax=Natrinema thermotolerans TaxID=121872 RepID=UPI000679D873|nr:tyrosine-type recombinase/integrase [Natrinema thermotolerans]QCC57378.1 site-specific integrase [Natrinema thermotolerans]
MESDYKEVIQRKLDLIRETDRIDDESEVKLLEYYDEIQQHNRESTSKQQLSGTRIESYLAHLLRIARETGVLVETLSPEDGEDAVDDILEWVDDNYDNGYTIDNYHSSVRSWGRFMAPDAEVVAGQVKLPDRIEKVKLGNVEEDQPAPDPTEVLFWNDIVQIIEEGCLDPRTTAMVATLWALGCRPMSEFWELKFGDFTDQGDHFLVSIPEHTKTGSRTIRMDVGTPYLRQWLENEHPVHDEGGPSSDTYVWTKRNDNEHLAYRDLRRNINRAAERAGITKPHPPKHYRASRASVLASSRHVTQRTLEYHFGWVKGSRVAAHYIAEFGNRSRKYIAMADGANISLEEEEEPIVPVVCDGCNRYTPRHRDSCLWCSADTVAELGRNPVLVTTPSVADEGEDLLDMITDGEATADDLRAIERLEHIIKQRDDLWDRLPQYIELAERMDG